MAKKTRKAAYVVRKGRIPGLYLTWEDCQEQVDGFKGNNYESFVLLKDAEQAWQIISTPPPLLSTSQSRHL
ncbi:hypothetical protein DL95DRAFT_386504, partial [Leptodontidium sp. 2 PMI_412]